MGLSGPDGTDGLKHYSALRVVTRPEHLETCSARLAALEGIEVHHRDPATGRMIVVHESETLDEQRERLNEIQHLPHVIVADLVMHYVDPPDDSAETATSSGPRGTTP